MAVRKYADELGVSLGGQAGAWAYGQVSFSLDAIVAEAGVRATLKFFHTYLTPAMKPELKQLKGDVSLVTTAFSLFLEAYVRVGYSYAAVEESVTLAHMKEQQENAYQIQKNLLPKASPEIEGYDIAGASTPAQTVGGDYFDFIARVDGRWAVCLGDVSGKGVPASLIMASDNSA